MTRARVVRDALEQYLEALDDLARGQERLRDPADPVPDWEAVKAGLAGQEQSRRMTSTK